MANEYKLPYTAEEIDETLGQVKDKVDKINYSSNAPTSEWDIGLYGELYGSKPALIKTTPSATPNTIPKRDATGAISVSINIQDSEGNNYVGGAAPHTWVQDKLNELNVRLYDFKNNADECVAQERYARAEADNNLQSQIDKLKNESIQISELNSLENVVQGKKITKYTIAAGGSLTLRKNAAYILLADGSSNTASIYNSGALQYEGTDNELTFKVGIIIIPDNTMGSSVEYPPSYYSLAIKISSGSSLLGIPDVNSAKFSVLKEVMESGGLVAKENSGTSTFSVWEIQL